MVVHIYIYEILREMIAVHKIVERAYWCAHAAACYYFLPKMFLEIVTVSEIVRQNDVHIALCICHFQQQAKSM